MVRYRPFRAVRPAAEFAADVAALPYDVMTSDEARALTRDNPLSFLHIDRAEIDLPERTDPYSPEVYEKAKENFDRLLREGVFLQDEAPRFYVYRLTMDGRSQTGLVGCASIDDYESGIIKKHELTRADKEADRVRHVDALDANTGPIFMVCRSNDAFSTLLASATNTKDAGTSHCCECEADIGRDFSSAPIYDFIAEDGVRHEVWALDESYNEKVGTIFGAMDSLYIADGHHRTESAARVGRMRRKQNPGWTGDEEFSYFLAVVFPEEQLEILDYNRTVADLNGLNEEEFLSRLGEHFNVVNIEEHFSVLEINAQNDGPGAPEHSVIASEAKQSKPSRKHQFGMYLGGQWYMLEVKQGLIDDSDPVRSLDVSVLQDYILGPILGVSDPRTDNRVDFIGGIRGLSELERRVDTDMKVAFAMYPTSLDELFAIADAGLIMPPKSTWFEPKLRCGLFSHMLK